MIQQLMAFVFSILLIACGYFLMKPYMTIRKMRKGWAYIPDGIITEKRVWSGRKNSIVRPTVRFIVDDEIFEVTTSMGQSPPLRIEKKSVSIIIQRIREKK